MPDTDTVYRKRGRRYEPIGLRDVPLIVQPGWHLVHVTDGCRTTHFNINPDDACRRAGREMLADELVPIVREVVSSSEMMSWNDMASHIARALERHFLESKGGE